MTGRWHTRGRWRALVLGALLSGSLAAAPARLIEWPARAVSPGFSLVDERGRIRTPADYRGQVSVVLFGFARCPDVCPAELFKLSAALQQLPRGGEGVQVLFITLDPAHDTRPVLKQYVQAFNPHFQGLTGSAAQVDAASESFHVTYAQVPAGSDYTLDHSSAVYLFDRHARLRFIGTADAAVGEYARGLAALLAEAP